MKFFFKSFFSLVLAFSITQMAMAQQRTLEETLGILSADAAKKYLSPISSAFGSDLNGGWFHRAPEAKKFGFDLEIGFVVMGSFFPTEAQRFLTEGTFVFPKS